MTKVVLEIKERVIMGSVNIVNFIRKERGNKKMESILAESLQFYEYIKRLTPMIIQSLYTICSTTSHSVYETLDSLSHSTLIEQCL